MVFFSVLDWRCYCSGWVNCLVSKLSGRVSYELRNRPCSPWSLWLSGRTSERGIRRSEIRFLLGTQNFFLCPTLVTRRWKKHLSLNCLVYYCILYRQCIEWDLYAPRAGYVLVHVSDHCLHEHMTQELFCSVGIFKKKNRELLGLILLHCSLHFFIIILFVGMLEKAVFFSEYNNINITGETSKCSYFSHSWC